MRDLLQEKIVIVGLPGAGKSTFAGALSSAINIRAIHLDYFLWPGWNRKSEDVRSAIMQELLKEEQWIIKGSYRSFSDLRLAEADTIIF